MISPSEFTDLSYELDSDGIVTLKFNRPDRKNGLSQLTGLELRLAASHFQSDPNALAMIITGAHLADCPIEKQVFCSGAYFGADAFQGIDPDLIAHIDREDIALKGVVEAFLSVNKPVIAAVNGAAVGGGFTLPLMICDLIFHSEVAWVKLPFASLGISAEVGSSYILPRLLGFQRAKELLFYPAKIPADRLVELGLGNAVVPHEELLGFARNKAMEIVPPSGSASSIAAMKELVNGSRREEVLQVLDRENASLNKLFRHADFQEALTARFERRKPAFARPSS